MGLRSVTALEIAGPVGADAWALAAARLCARHAAARHVVLQETASGRLRLVDVASVVGYIAGRGASWAVPSAALRWTAALCAGSASAAWTPARFTAPLYGARSARASTAGPRGWRQHEG